MKIGLIKSSQPYRWLVKAARNNHFLLSLLALVLGFAAGTAAIAFREGIILIQEVGFGFGGERVASLAAELPWWQLLLVPAVGGLLVGPAVHFLLPGRRPQSVQHVIEASALRSGRMPLLVGIKAAIISVVSIGSGASVGREGPMVHLGATFGSWIGQRFRLGRAMSRTLLGCGVAAAVAASFNAPVAGTFFALEVVVGHYALSAFAPIVIASVAGTLVSRGIYGAFPAFILPDQWIIVSYWEFPAFALLGLVSAIAAVLFMNSVMLADKVVNKVPVPLWARPAVGGLIVGAIAIAYPEVLGVGYEATDAALSDLYPLQLLLLLIVAKTLATAVSLASGFVGGVFSPSLFIGAMVGGAFGVIATAAFPELSSGHGAYTLIGMGAVAGAVLGAPMSTIIIIFELTGDYELTMGVMLATVIASLLVQQLCVPSFFHWQLQRRGVFIAAGLEMGLLNERRVSELVDPEAVMLPEDSSLASARIALQASHWGKIFLVDDAGRLTGILDFAALGAAACDRARDEDLKAADLALEPVDLLLLDDSLERALDRHRQQRDPHLPVVADLASSRLVGLCHESEVMAAYREALESRRAEAQGDLTG